MMYHPDQKRQAKALKNLYEYNVPFFIYEKEFGGDQEHNVRNAILDEHIEKDYVITLDSDEIILPKDLKVLLKIMETKEYDVGVCGILDYLSKDSVIEPKRDHQPIIFTKPSKRFYSNRCIMLPEKYAKVPIDIHHFGYLINIKWKIHWYDRFDQIEKRKMEKLLESPTRPIEAGPEINRFIKAIQSGLMKEAAHGPAHKLHHIDWALSAIESQLRLFNKQVSLNAS
jgi:hypothetical protein